MKLGELVAHRNKRNSNIEVLRILSVFLIIAHHFAVHSGFNFGNSSNFNAIFVDLLNFGGGVGINCLVLISGYFLVKDTRWNFKKIFLLWFRLFVYSVVLFAVFCLVGKLSFSWKELAKSFVPVMTDDWGYFTSYFVLYLFHPFVNMALNNLNKKAYFLMLSLMLLLWSIIPTMAHSEVWKIFIYTLSGNELEAVQLNRFVWYLFLYCVAGYVQMHVSPQKLNFTPLLVSTIASYVILFIISITVYVGFKKGSFYNEMETLQMFIPSLLLFLTCITAKPRSNKVINFIAPSMLGVYLLHEHGPTTRAYFWRDLFHGTGFAESPYLALYALGAIVAVFAICLVIDFAYSYSVELLLRKGLDTERGEKLCERFSLDVEPEPVVVEATENHAEEMSGAEQTAQNTEEKTEVQK